jgi:hypothetical protein
LITLAYFVILSSDANMVESFDREDEALAALEQIAQHDSESADEYAMLQFDDAGHPVGEAMSAAEVGSQHPATA